MELFLTVFYTLLFCFLIYKLPFFNIKTLAKKYLLSFFLLKVLFGICLFFIYTLYYTDPSQADIFRYFDDAKVIYSALPDRAMDYLKMILGNDSPYFTQHYYSQMNHWERLVPANIFSDSHIIIRFNAIVMLFSFGYFNVHTVFACFLSFFGLTALYKFFEKNIKKITIWSVFVIFLLPSVLFWTSGVLKECLIIFSIGTLIYCFDLLLFPKQNSQKLGKSLCLFGGCCLSALVLVYTKGYYLLLLLPLLVLWGLIKKMKWKKPLLIYLLGGSMVVCGGYFGAKAVGYDASALIAFKHNDMLHLAMEKEAEVTDTIFLENNLLSLFSYLPRAVVNASFRPFIFESLSPFAILAEIESLVLIVLSLLALWYSFNKNNPNKNLFWFCFFFAIGNLIVVGLAAPIFGAIVRYRSITMPFAFMAVLLLCDYRLEKITTRLFKKVKKKK